MDIPIPDVPEHHGHLVPHLHQALMSLARAAGQECPGSAVRCHVLHQSARTSYVVSVRWSDRGWFSAVLGDLLKRPLAETDRFWILQRAEVDAVLLAGGTHHEPASMRAAAGRARHLRA
jgi:hypothetical protein